MTEGFSVPSCPVPLEWMQFGAPPEAMAEFSEGFCPVHHTGLAPVMISRGGKGKLPRTWVDAGRCDACADGCGADWHLTEYQGQPMLTATWDTSARPGLGGRPGEEPWHPRCPGRGGGSRPQP